jgi:perosamine synthetase
MTSMERIPVSGPWITQKEIDYVTDAVTNAWYGNANMYHVRFEKAFAEQTGRKHAVALPSCTAALHLALMALGVGPGDEVVVPEITWIASAAPVSYVGADLRFADVDPDSWCLDAASFERAITPRTKAVIVVNLYGNLPDMDAILEVARRHRVAVIEDAAESAGGEYRGRPAGSFGDISTFSFHGSKTLTTGEGGLLLTDADDLHERVQFLRDHGRKPGDKLFWNTEIAHKYKMSSMQAALGLAQLERLGELVARKREIFGWYRHALAGVPGITLNAEAEGVRNAYWMITAILDPSHGLDKEALMAELATQNIDSRPFFYPLSSLPAYESAPDAARARRKNEVAYRLSPFGLNLPSGLNLTPELVGRVCHALTSVLSAGAVKAGRR